MHSTAMTHWNNIAWIWENFSQHIYLWMFYRQNEYYYIYYWHYLNIIFSSSLCIVQSIHEFQFNCFYLSNMFNIIIENSINLIQHYKSFPYFYKFMVRKKKLYQSQNIARLSHKSGLRNWLVQSGYGHKNIYPESQFPMKWRMHQKYLIAKIWNWLNVANESNLSWKVKK